MKPMTEEDICLLVQARWYQAHRHEYRADWDEFMKLLLCMADDAVRHEDEELASDLYFLAGLAYQRSLEFAPCDLRRAA